MNPDILFILFVVVVAVGSWIAQVMKKDSSGGGSGGTPPQGRSQSGGVSLEELAERRRRQLEELARRRQQQQGGAMDVSSAEPSNLSVGESTERDRAREAYEQRAAALREQAERDQRQQREREEATRRRALTQEQARQREEARARQAQAAREQEVARQRRAQALRQKQSDRQSPRTRTLGKLQSNISERRLITDGILDETHGDAYAQRAEVNTTVRIGQAEVAPGSPTGAESVIFLNGQSLKQAIILRELLDQPIALRQQHVGMMLPY